MGTPKKDLETLKSTLQRVFKGNEKNVTPFYESLCLLVDKVLILLSVHIMIVSINFKIPSYIHRNAFV